MTYKQIKPKKIYEEVAEAILDTIKKGEIKPGEKLNSVQQLAEDFHVGRSAIREALSALRAMGIIEMRQGEGTYVKEFDPHSISGSLFSSILMNRESIAHLLEVRKILEAGIAASAAKNRTEEDIEELNRILLEMKGTIGNEELGEKADFDFHMAIARASRNPMLMGLMNNVSEMMLNTMRETRRIWLYSKQTTSKRLYQEHVKIFEAISAKDEAKAQELMMNHLANVEEVLMKYLKK
ncbi:FCD domain-containing protein [Bacillus mangrovi]|uniref:FCD domain-containing protein n=1 Tax=Metabacillus mangrovi TaxID=1491830 RepID=A0A7X2S4S0_9BACI|nr:FCD domain-containing protein [Metabacillus mangrovi]